MLKIQLLLSKPADSITLMEFSELFSLLQCTDETDRMEAKKAAHGLGDSFLETVCAFSNEPGLGGGYILLGITKNSEALEPRYIISGLTNPDEIQQQIATLCRQNFNIPISPTIHVVPQPEGTVILVYIPEVSAYLKPIYIKKRGLESGAYRRIGPTDQVCTAEDLDFLYQTRSEKKYDEMAVERASLDDLDPQAIRAYRLIRKEFKADAAELAYTDVDLLASVQATVMEKGATYPTVAGLLLFGTVAALSRLFPMRSRIDYLLVEGTRWVPDPDRRFTSIEFCEPLMLGFPRILNRIMNDIDQIFSLNHDTLQRMDKPIIPRAVVREALVNAIMHRDYRTISALQIIRYANRIEFRNPGFSLKPHDQLGLPGSMPRNEILTKIFRDINFAETKGTGMSTMREDMRNANLSVPLVESDGQAIILH